MLGRRPFQPLHRADLARSRAPPTTATSTAAKTMPATMPAGICRYQRIEFLDLARRLLEALRHRALFDQRLFGVGDRLRVGVDHVAGGGAVAQLLAERQHRRGERAHMVGLRRAAVLLLPADVEVALVLLVERIGDEADQIVVAGDELLVGAIVLGHVALPLLIAAAAAPNDRFCSTRFAASSACSIDVVADHRAAASSSPVPASGGRNTLSFDGGRRVVSRCRS